jgi:serine/threonine protein kinase
MHEIGIVHYDINLSNMCLDPNTNVVKLIDFGLAEWREPTTSWISSWKGTDSYLAPEVARRSECNHTLDIWSFGILLLEMVRLCMTNVIGLDNLY